MKTKNWKKRESSHFIQEKREPKNYETKKLLRQGVNFKEKIRSYFKSKILNFIKNNLTIIIPGAGWKFNLLIIFIKPFLPRNAVSHNQNPLRKMLNLILNYQLNSKIF